MLSRKLGPAEPNLNQPYTVIPNLPVQFFPRSKIKLVRAKEILKNS